MPRIFELAHRLDQSLDNVHLVVKGELYGNFRQLEKARFLFWLVLFVLAEKINQARAINSIERKNSQNPEIEHDKEQIGLVHFIQITEISLWIAGKARDEF